jgi:hypothetical protein
MPKTVEQILSEQKTQNSKRFETVNEDHYRFHLPAIATVLDVDRLRREHHELIGELTVRCDLPGAKTVVDGIVSMADFNFSSARARTDRAKLIGARVKGQIEWPSLLEELCFRVLQAERNGSPGVDLRTFEDLPENDDIRVQGFQFPRRHPTIIFGDGDSAKSYTALWLAGSLVEQGFSVGLFDWELSGRDHKARLLRLFPDGMPKITYIKCDRPLVQELDRLRRCVHDDHLDYVVFDSVAYACDGPPEAAEIAGRYFRSVRQLGIGSLHIAHTNRSETGDQKPFGSVFWWNSARSIWFAKRADEEAESETLELGFFPRKHNLARRPKPIGFSLTFDDQSRTVTFQPADPVDTPEFAAKMKVHERMAALLRKGPMSVDEIAIRIVAKKETVQRIARRHTRHFIVLDGGKVGLRSRREES